MNALEAVFSAVVDTSWRASCLIVLVLGLRRLVRGRVAAWLLFLVWLAVAARLLLPISMPAAWSPFNWATWTHTASSAPEVPPSPTIPERADAPSPTAAGPRTFRNSAFAPLPDLSLLQGMALIWASGMVVLLLVRVAAHRSLARKPKRAVVLPGSALPPDVWPRLESRGVRVCITDAVTAPALTGIFRPRILFPPGFLERLTPAEVRLTIAHELAHAERRDLLADAILHLAVTAHWFNPLAWLAARTAREDCELACDERVVRRASDDERDGYGATLLTLARLTNASPRPQLGLGVVSSKRHIKRRIHMIIANPAFTLSGTLLSGAVLLVLTGLSFTSELVAQETRSSAVPLAVPRPVPTAADVGSTGIAYNPAVDRLDVLFPTGVVATVNDRNITVTDVRNYIAGLIPQLQKEARSQEEFNGRLSLLQNSAIKDLVNRVVLIRQFHDQRGGQEPRTIAREHVDTYIADSIAERFGGDRSKFLDYLRSRNLTQAAYRKEVEEDIIYNYMRGQERKLAGKTSPTKLDPAEKPIRLRLIQLSRTDGETDASLLEKANAIVSRFRNGQTFESLAQEFDQSAPRMRGKDWGWQGPADVRAPFRDALMALQKGEVSAPILVPEGCFLLYAEDRR